MQLFSRKQLGFAAFTFAIYTLLVGWKVALMLVIGVGFHECCHLWAAHWQGLKTKGFYLVPFMGGVALVDDTYKTYRQQAIVVLAGPAGGGLLALVTAGAYYLTGLPWLAAAALWMCWLNLFNLLPFSFMDGGQLLRTITYSVNRTFGMVCMSVSTVAAVIALWFFNPVICGLVLLFGGVGMISEYRNWKAFRDGKTYLCSQEYLNPPHRLSINEIGVTLMGWGATAAILSFASHLLRTVPASSLKTLLPH